LIRTLVISDLHIGCRVRTSVLARPAPLELLLNALDSVDRLVLLGDVLELLEASPRDALQEARPILRAIGARLGREREVVLVPGNHDRALVRPWLREHSDRLTPETVVPADATPLLDEVTALLAPAAVRVSYPGVRLSERVWATHGHYLDQHLFPVSSYGLMRSWLRRVPPGSSAPLEYELRSRPQVSRLMRVLPGRVEALLDDLAEVLRASTMPRLHRRVLNPRIAPLTSRLLGLQVRGHSLPAIAEVAHRLGVESEWLVFGHVHRLGPVAGDDPARWAGPPRIANTGSWLYEPLLIHRQLPPHPYWPGGAVTFSDGEEPRAVGLLDQLGPADVR
jgi:UDP-2,3-diacylglucosamine pyrophosphatase LpxH